jgi:type II secretory pathway pseudopilin PulG
MNINLKQKNNSKGFTLIEALVAISILMVAIASPMTLAQKGLSTATLSKDQMIASFLAQDAIESVRNIRDQIAVSDVSPADWLGGNGVNGNGPTLTNCICSGDACNFDSSAPKYCAIDTTSTVWSSASIFPNQNTPTLPGPLEISYDTNLKFLKYDYTGSHCDSSPSTICTSKFTRYINIKQNPGGSNPDEAIVSVRVSWNSSQGVQNIDLQDFIYNYSANL